MQQQVVAQNNMRCPMPASNAVSGSGMMSPNASIDVGHGGGGMPPFDQQDVKPRIPPSMYRVLVLAKSGIYIPNVFSVGFCQLVPCWFFP